MGFPCDEELIADLTVRERLATFVVSHQAAVFAVWTDVRTGETTSKGNHESHRSGQD